MIAIVDDHAQCLNVNSKFMYLCTDDRDKRDKEIGGIDRDRERERERESHQASKSTEFL